MEYTYNFVKKVLGVRKNTQDDFVYGELGELLISPDDILTLLSIGLKY